MGVEESSIGLKQLLGIFKAGLMLSVASGNRLHAAYCHLRNLCFKKSDPKRKEKGGRNWKLPGTEALLSQSVRFINVF